MTAQGSADRFAYSWGRYSSLLPDHEEQFRRWSAPLLPEDWRDSWFLDVGCGMGRNSHWPMRYGALGGWAIDKAVLLALALASADLALGACWAVCLDVGADHAGVVTGFMNTFGNLGGLVAPLVVGLAVERWRSWTLPFHVTALVYALGALAWLAVDPYRKLSSDTSPT